MSLPNDSIFLSNITVPLSALDNLDIEPTWLLLTVFMDVICGVVIIGLMLTILLDKTMRNQPSKWLLLNCCVAILIKAFVLIARIHHMEAGIPSVFQVPGLCECLEVIHLMKTFLTPISILQMTIERLACLIKINTDPSAFGPVPTIVFIAAGWVICLVMALIGSFVLGTFLYYKDTCYLVSFVAGGNTYYVLFANLILINFSLTIITIVFYCFKKMSPTDKLPIVLFVGISNGVYISFQMMAYIPFLTAWISGSYVDSWVLLNIYFTYLFIVPLCWLFSSADIRDKLLGFCCSCLIRVHHERVATDDVTVILQEMYDEDL